MRVRIYQINKKADSLNRYGLPLENAEELQGFPGVDFSAYQKVIDTKVKKRRKIEDLVDQIHTGPENYLTYWSDVVVTPKGVFYCDIFDCYRIVTRFANADDIFSKAQQKYLAATGRWQEIRHNILHGYYWPVSNIINIIQVKRSVKIYEN